MKETRTGRASQSGSTLIEALVSTLILTSALVVLAQLVAMATSTNVLARHSTIAAILAEQKMEQLRSLAWDFDASGSPRSDLSTDISARPEMPAGGAGLQASPGSLRRNTPGYVDHVDGRGSIVGGGARPPPASIYTRRWSVEPLSGSGDVLLIQVLVTPNRERGSADGGSVGRLRGEARLVSVRPRKAR